MGLTALPVASVTRLLPTRRARIGAVLWALTGMFGLLTAAVCALAAPRWATHPLTYTPHLERPLPHICFVGAAQWWIGVELVRLLTIVALLAWLGGIARFFLGLRATAAAVRRAAPLKPLPNSLHPRVFVAEGACAGSTALGFFVPYAVISSHASGDLPPEAQAAILWHEVNHMRWRDPLARLVLSALAVCWPIPGVWVLREWSRLSELSADDEAITHAGAVAWHQALAALDIDRARVDERVWEARENKTGGGWLAAGISWVLLGLAASILYGHSGVLSVVCLFETLLMSWR